MKNEPRNNLETFMQRAIELAQDKEAGKPCLSGKELIIRAGRNEHTLEDFIKKKLMPNAQCKYWTERQAHLFQGLCNLELWYGIHTMAIRRHLLIWIWMECGELYGITLEQIKQVMLDWAKAEAKLPQEHIPNHVRSLVCWGKEHLIGEKGALPVVRCALETLREKRQEARKLPLAQEDYQTFREEISDGLNGVIEEIRLIENWPVKESDQEVEKIACMLTSYEYTLDCLQSKQEGFADYQWYWAHMLCYYTWRKERQIQVEPQESLEMRIFNACHTLAIFLSYSKNEELINTLPKELRPQEWEKVTEVKICFVTSPSGQLEIEYSFIFKRN
jgi:hypothetical protein